MARARHLLIVGACCAALAAPAHADRGEGRLEKRLAELKSKGDTLAALEVAEALLRSRRSGADAAPIEAALTEVVQLTTQSGDYVRAIPYHEELLRLVERRVGPEAPEMLNALTGLAMQYWYAQRYEEADALLQRQLTLQRKVSGADSPSYAFALETYGLLMQNRSSYAAAERAFVEASAILTRKLGGGDASIERLLHDLATLHLAQGQVDKAVPLFDRVMAIHAAAPAEDRAPIASTIAAIYRHFGVQERAAAFDAIAEKDWAHAVTELEKADPDRRLPIALGALGEIYRRKKEFGRAESSYRRALDESRKREGPGGGTAYLAHLAYTAQDAGRPRDALTLLLQFRAAFRRTAGATSAAWIDAVIADIHRELGQYRHAESLLRRTIEAISRSHGATHPMVGDYRESLAILLLAAGKPGAARVELERSLAIAEPNLRVVLATGTESDHAVYLDKIARQLDVAINFHARHLPRDGAAAHLAMTALLRHKGRILDDAAGSAAALRRRLGPDERKLLDELTSARARLARLVVAGAAAPRAVAELQATVDRLEDASRRRSGALREATTPIELGAIQRAIPAGAVLLELVGYRAFDVRAAQARQKGAPRYAAYLLRPRGEPELVDLGPAAPIDAAAAALSEALADPDSDLDEVSERGRALHRLTFARLAAKLGRDPHVLVAPDGALNLVPFGALVDERGRFLVERYTFTYLTSGRDLIRLAAPAPSRQPPVIVANPNFADTGPAPSSPIAARRSGALGRRDWQALPGTAEEAAELARVLTGATVLSGKRATEKAIKALHGPRLLHIATHGFFLPTEQPAADAAPSTRENPLLRSGLVLAGANRLSSGDDDGILTALEASSLDLAGTQMVALSACETGVGQIRNGQGVYGLRRAFIVAGARSLVMSLWQVDDKATRDLMTSFYRRLERGEDRAGAVRRAQLDLLRSPRYRHPYYWASFVAAGDWTPLAQR
jgi:CHAT domain-containing protein/tetratricopeptide (TPR) repeat protein